MIEIFNFAFGPYPQRLNIYLAEKQPGGVAMTVYAQPDTLANMPPPEIGALTPMGSLPILRHADGTVIGQSLAILDYIEAIESGGRRNRRRPVYRAVAACRKLDARRAVHCRSIRHAG